MLNSSASHAAYTSCWAHELEVPLFSVDYRLTPENPYPAAFEDAWEAYCWIMKYARKYLGILP
jgi:hormone-sensitive lipase